MRNFLFVILLMMVLYCKDPIYKKCDGLCNIHNRCNSAILQNLKNFHELDERKWLNFFYSNCIDACMIYNQEIFECFQENQIHIEHTKNSHDDLEICPKIADCIFPIFLNQ